MGFTNDFVNIIMRCVISVTFSVWVNGKYLGLLTVLGRSSKEAFEYMPNKIRGLVGSWSGHEVSCAGREVLLKSVAQAVPTYPMSYFLTPKDTCQKIKTVISNYWWGSSADSQHLHW